MQFQLSLFSLFVFKQRLKLKQHGLIDLAYRCFFRFRRVFPAFFISFDKQQRGIKVFFLQFGILEISRAIVVRNSNINAILLAVSPIVNYHRIDSRFICNYADSNS
ncbi:hypothetical protein D0T25_20635 [Duganella sp. BJB488]|nr:hypothetical protein D0T26_17010 [Duganella sp. BJB489]RFP17985.1 hypothetical protein D0T25_20635 [Duganella sp. BJB488]